LERDYAWILKEWKIGREALQRSLDVLAWDYFDQNTLSAYQEDHRSTVLHHILSMTGMQHNCSPEVMLRHSLKSMKEFYFTFAETWLNYTIAGCNSTNKCLIGLHGHVFDISNFVEQHPGSTETLLLQAGRDATGTSLCNADRITYIPLNYGVRFLQVFFETMGHSLGARRLALSMCVVINARCIHEDKDDCIISKKNLPDNWGLLRPSSPAFHVRRLSPGFIIPRKRSKPRTSGALLRFRNAIKREAITELTKADRWGRTTLGTGNLFGGVQVYFDPICCKWRWWYTDLSFEPVFTESAE
jgi:cytochrome b involved in lipid metabolism